MKKQPFATIQTLLTPTQVKAALGYRSATNHILRHLELRGALRPIRLNARVLRYRAEDVERLINDAASR